MKANQPSATPPTTSSADPAVKPDQRSASSKCSDLMTGAFVFAIVAGCVALFVADLSLIAGGIAATVGGISGMLFADG